MRPGVQGEEREKLLTQRATLVQEIKDLQAKPLPTKSAASAQHRVEDLEKLAKKVNSIDKKLGRI